RDILLQQQALLLQLRGIPHAMCRQLTEDHFPSLRYRPIGASEGQGGKFAPPTPEECFLRGLDMERKHGKAVYQLRRSEQELGEVQSQLSRRVADVRELKARLQDQSAEFERRLHRERTDAVRRARESHQSFQSSDCN
ncbi:MAG: hypothetical protein Q8P67_15140, partial [archaeon]|nr:hypothetical protein [archaeon]